MIDLPLRKNAHVYGVGTIICVADPFSGFDCHACCLCNTPGCDIYECRSEKRADRKDVHFEKVKRLSISTLISVLANR